MWPMQSCNRTTIMLVRNYEADVIHALRGWESELHMNSIPTGTMITIRFESGEVAVEARLKSRRKGKA